LAFIDDPPQQAKLLVETLQASKRNVHYEVAFSRCTL